MHLDARYLTWNRTHVINKGAVFLRCNSCEFSETPRRHGLRQHQGVLWLINIMINRRVRQEVKIHRERDREANILD